MKKVLSELHNAIIELEDNNSIKEAKILDEVFVKLSNRANRGKRYEEVVQNTTRPQLTDENGEPNLNVTDYSLGRPEDAKIQSSDAYKTLKKRWLEARDKYVAVKRLSMMGNRLNNQKQYSVQGLKIREDKYRKKWEAAEDDLAIWYIGAFIQVKSNKPVPQIMQLQLEDITDEKKKLNKPVVKPQVQTKPKPKVQPETNPVSKPSTPQVAKPKPVQKTTTPVTTDGRNLRPLEINQAEVVQKAQEYLDQLKQRMTTYGEQTWQAYTNMQFKVYGEDKTPGKQIYRLWQVMIDEYKQQQQPKQETTTVQNNNQDQPEIA